MKWTAEQLDQLVKDINAKAALTSEDVALLKSIFEAAARAVEERANPGKPLSDSFEKDPLRPVAIDAVKSSIRRACNKIV